MWSPFYPAFFVANLRSRYAMGRYAPIRSNALNQIGEGKLNTIVTLIAKNAMPMTNAIVNLQVTAT
jgi:hypothetical protein